MMHNKIIGFICPLKSECSEARFRSDDIMENVLTPIANKLGYTIQRADQLSGSSIMQDIIKMLQTADIIIADLTDMNPNVLYELGLRQATRGKCINIYCKDENSELPFDISHYRVHAYKRNATYKEIHNFEEFIESRIKDLESARWDPLIKLSTEDLIDIYNVTVVSHFFKGAKNHYSLAKDLFKAPCKRIFLMQRSSSLVLNAEQGWGEEAEFIRNIKPAIDVCGFFYHIISLDGIRAHFLRKNSVFPDFKKFSRNLQNKGGNVAVRKNSSSNDKVFYLKKLPKDTQDSFFKLDRQSRVLITESMNGVVRAVIVQNLGPDQTCFLIEGNKAKEYLEVCIEFYNTCELVEWKELKALYEEYKKIEKQKETE